MRLKQGKCILEYFDLLRYYIQSKDSQNHRMMLLWCFFILVALVLSAVEETNQITNGQFINPGLPQGYLYRFYGKEIEGWSCTAHCQIINCTRFSEAYPKEDESSLNCRGYVIDLNSDGVNQVLSQVLSLQIDYYWLEFDYFFPQKNSNRKWLQIILNQDIISSLQTTLPQSMNRYHFKEKVLAKGGTNVLKLKNNGFYEDGSGFKISNISLHRQANNILQEALSQVFESDFLQKGSSIPGGRMFFFSLLSFMVNFDRLEFYLYHNRQYSQSLKLFLTKIKDLQSMKGSIVESQIKERFPSFVAEIQSFLRFSQRKMNYISYKIDDQEQRHETFPEYIKWTLTFSVPIILFIFFCLHSIFLLVQKWPISIFIRPYAFCATLIFIILEGSIEELTFHGFGELRSLFSFSFGHKIINLLSICSIFFVLFTCFGLYLWLKTYYKKKAKIITDAKYSTLQSLLSMGFDRGMVIFLLGCTQQLLLTTPTFQLFALFSIQICWITKKIYFRHFYHNISLFLISILQSLLRIYFQLTSFIFQFKQQYRDTINDEYHIYFIFCFIVMIGLNILCNLYCLIKTLLTTRLCHKNTIKNEYFQNGSEIKRQDILNHLREEFKERQDRPLSEPASRISSRNIRQKLNLIQSSYILKKRQIILSNKSIQNSQIKSKTVKIQDLTQ